MSNGPLLVIVPDYVSAIITKGEYQPRYYNPGEVFDEVHLLLTNSDRPGVRALERTVGKARLHVHNLPEDPLMHQRRWWWFDHRLLRRWADPAVELARSFRPALIRCHSSAMNLYAAQRIKMALGTPYVVSLHINPDVNPTRRFLAGRLSKEQWHINRLFEYVERVGLGDADLVMPVYLPIVPYLERMGVTRYEVCYNALNGDYLRSKTDYRLGSPPRILSVGRQLAEKDPSNIIRSVAELPEVELSLVGDGPLHADLKRLAVELGVTDRVRFETALPNDELCARIADYDLFAIHSEYWELNKSLLEALLTGMPIVLNRRRGLPVPELEGDFVIKVENTKDAYKTAFRALLRDGHAREDLGRRAFSRANALWHPSVTEAKFAGIYRRLMRTTG